MRLLLCLQIESSDFKESSFEGTEFSDKLQIFFGGTSAVVKRFDDPLDKADACDEVSDGETESCCHWFQTLSIYAVAG